jgi:hypothetical protein
MGLMLRGINLLCVGTGLRNKGIFLISYLADKGFCTNIVLGIIIGTG